MLDLSEARLSGSETDVEVYNLFGTVTVIVPDGVEVSVSGGGLFASEVIDTPARTMAQRAARADQRAAERAALCTSVARKPRRVVRRS